MQLGRYTVVLPPLLVRDDNRMRGIIRILVVEEEARYPLVKHLPCINAMNLSSIHRLRLFLPVVCCLAVAWLGAQFRPGPWYEALQKAPLTPPNLAFPIAWSILYTLIGISGVLIERRGSSGGEARRAYYLQLLLNGLWTPIFFGLNMPLLGLVEIIALLIAIFITIRRAMKVSRTAGYLLFPYLVWVAFATYLNAGIVLLN